ncbi:hypothetical protein KC317_g4730, partial [Hortaea werneckii]
MTDQQTDGPSVPYQPSSGGPHPTLAGNMFDPNVRADGAMSGSQEGVGGQDERTMHAEGLEHIKNKAGIGSGAAASSTTSSTTGASTTTGHPPSTNPSAEDPSGGIPQGAGGVSSSAHKMSPVEGVVGHENEGQKSGLLGSTLAYLGLGGSGGSRAPTQPDTEVGQNADAPHQPTSGSGISGGSGAAAAGAGALGAGRVAAAAATAAGKDNEQSAETESTPTSSGGKEEASKPQSEESSSAKPQEKTSHDHDSQRENRDAIPLAGGEKIGGKAWGSSKVVPDNPKPRESTQVSSEEGQGDEQTQNNTSSNQGDAKPPQQHINENKSQGSSSSEKHGLAEKMKEKLHIGSHH